jgi:hypothetical protein
MKCIIRGRGHTGYTPAYVDIGDIRLHTWIYVLYEDARQHENIRGYRTLYAVVARFWQVSKPSTCEDVRQHAIIYTLYEDEHDDI